MAEFSETKSRNKPTSIILLGQAASGRSNILANAIERLRLKAKNSYAINLDPLTESETLYNINIGDSTPYNDIKQQYNFSHNKTLLTSLNLFTARIDQVFNILSEKEETFEYLFIDTPNPEIFLWSPSGVIIPQRLASRYPTTILYVLDCQRCRDPIVFMNSIIDVCSVKIRLGLPLVVVCNKIDLFDWNVMKSWMEDSEPLMSAILEQEESITNVVASKVYDFPKICQELKIINTSMVTNEGLDELIKAIDESKTEFDDSYELAVAKTHNTRIVDILNKQIKNLNSIPNNNNNFPNKQIENLTSVPNNNNNFLNIPIQESIQTSLIGDVCDEPTLQYNINNNNGGGDDDDDEAFAEAYMRKNFLLFGDGPKINNKVNAAADDDDLVTNNSDEDDSCDDDDDDD